MNVTRKSAITGSALALATSSMALALLCTATAPAGEKGRGGGAPPAYYYGLPHYPQGNATLGVDPLGRLTINNLGSSGKDGVQIDFGQATACAMQCVTPEAGMWPGSSSLRVESTQQSVQFDAVAGGGAAMTFDPGDFQVQCLHVRLLLHDVVVDSRVFMPGELSQPLVTGDFGSDASGTPMVVEMVSNGREDICNVFEIEHTLAITGSPTGPVQCDQVALSLDGLPPGKPVIGTLRVTGSNMPGGEMTIAGETLGAPSWGGGGGGGSGGSTTGTIRVAGNAHMTGVAGPDICAGCPECCEFADPLVIPSGIVVNNIGSSAEDGVVFECRPWGSPWFVTDLLLRTNPISLSTPGQGLHLRATGTYGGMPSHDLGECRVQSNPATGELQLSADFSPLGSNDLTIEVRSGGAVVGSVSATGGSGVALGTISSGGGLPVTWQKCGKLSGGVGQPPCFVLCTTDDFAFDDGSGVVLVGDDLRVLATGAAQSVTSLKSFSLLGENTDPFNVYSACGMSGSTTPTIRLAGGLVHSSIGQASLSLADVDGDGREDIVVANIGSSGNDGVSIDLHASDGCAVSINDADMADDSLTGLRFDNYDDQCPTCPNAVVGGIEIDYTGPGQAQFTRRRCNDCPLGHVILMKFTDEIAAEFDLLDDGPLLIETDPGARLSVDHVEFEWKVEEGESVCRLSQSSGGGLPSGVTVSHPVYGSFSDIAQIIVRQPNSVDDIHSITRACVMATAGSICNPCSFAVTKSGVMMHGNAHTGRGQARVVASACDDSSGNPHDVLRVANIGSSGQDGVSIDLRSALWLDPDDDGDGLLDVVSGASWSWLPDGIESEDDWRAPISGSSSGGGGGDTELATITIDKATPGFHKALCSGYSWMPTPVITIVVRDQFGNPVPNGSANGLSLGQLCTLSTAVHESSYEVEFHGSSDAGAHMEQVSFVYKKITWPPPNDVRGGEPVTFTLPGSVVVDGSSLEVYVEPSSGNPVATDLVLHALDLVVTAPGGATVAFGIDEEGVNRLAWQCESDLTDNGATNLPDGAVNVFDLLQVLTNWNTGGTGAAIAMPRNVVDVFDLLKLLVDWGNCD